MYKTRTLGTILVFLVLGIGTLSLGAQMNAVNIVFAANNGNTIIQKLNQNSICTFPEEPGFCNTIAGVDANIHASMNSLIVEKQAQKNGCEGTNCTDSANTGASILGIEQTKIIQKQN